MNNSSLLADVSGIPYFCFEKMRKYLLSLALVVGVVSMNAQEKVTNNVNMENKKSIIYFIKMVFFEILMILERIILFLYEAYSKNGSN